jgi:hypothetical protein
MAIFTWRRFGNEAHTETRFGTANIVEENGEYSWHLVQPALGISMTSHDRFATPPFFDSFEEAEKFVLLTLSLLAEPPSVAPRNPRRWLLDSEASYAGMKHSFGLGLLALPSDFDPAIAARLRMAWIVLFHEDWPLEPMVARESDSPDPISSLAWREHDGVFRATTRFGIAVIEQQSGNFNPRIEHPSGATYSILTGRHPDIHFPTFDRAEDFVLDNVQRLAEIPPVYPAEPERTRRIGKPGQYSPVVFALDVCMHSLPPESDPIDVQRFENMKDDMYDHLD